MASISAYGQQFSVRSEPYFNSYGLGAQPEETAVSETSAHTSGDTATVSDTAKSQLLNEYMGEIAEGTLDLSQIMNEMMKTRAKVWREAAEKGKEREKELTALREKLTAQTQAVEAEIESLSAEGADMSAEGAQSTAIKPADNILQNIVGEGAGFAMANGARQAKPALAQAYGKFTAGAATKYSREV